MQTVEMPHSIRAEEMLIASLLIDPGNFGECSELTPAEIYSTTNRKIYETISDHINNRLPVDASLIGSKLGPEATRIMIACLDDPGPSGDIGHTARMIKSFATRRRLIEIANAISKRAQADQESESTLDYAYKEIAGLQSYGESDRGVSLRHVYTAERMIEEYEKYIRNLKNNRFITGIHEIDKRIRGVAGGEVMTILARAGSFKTAMLQNLLTGYIKNSTRGAVMFSIEMPVASVTERWFQILDGSTGKEIADQFQDHTKKDLCDLSKNQFKQDLKNLFIIPSKIGVESIPQYIKLIEQEYSRKIGLVGIDYLGLMDAKGETEYQQVSNLARGLKSVAKRINLPVVLLSQVSRKGGDGELEISLDMGRGSGAVEEAADFVLGLWQQEKNACSMETDERKEYDLICRILKNRKGPKGSRWTLELDPGTLKFGQGATEWIPPKRKKKVACDL